MEFKVGDRVRIIRDEEMFGLDYTGKLATVKAVQVDGFETYLDIIIDGVGEYSVDTTDVEKVEENTHE